MCVFFFFKQKTAYEMRISDWSSDVCSSDLLEEPDLERATAAETARAVLALAIAQRHVRKLSLKEILPNRSPVVPVPPQVQRSDARQVAAAFKRARHYFSGMDSRKSTRLNPVTNAHLVCRLLLEKKNINTSNA